MLKIKRFILVAVVSRPGFSSIELVCVLAILMSLATLIMPNVVGFQKSLEQCLLKNQSQILMADLRRIQAMSRYRTKEFNSILFDTQKERYWFMENIRRYELCDLAGAGYGLNAANKSNIFYHRGTVNSYNYIYLWRKSRPQTTFTIQILPVTGRVSVYRE